jgi:hypothetical protein
VSRQGNEAAILINEKEKNKKLKKVTSAGRR